MSSKFKWFFIGLTAACMSIVWTADFFVMEYAYAYASDSEKTVKAVWENGGQLGTVANIEFYAANGNKYLLQAEVEDESDWSISENSHVSISLIQKIPKGPVTKKQH